MNSKSFPKSSIKSRVIVAALIEKDGKFLFGKKANDVGPYPNTWHLLGGGVKLDSESLVDAVKREVKEEANIEISGIEKLFFDEDIEPDKNNTPTHYIFLLFKAKYKSGESRPSDDIEELKWFDKKEIKKIKLTRPSTKLFKELGFI